MLHLYVVPTNNNYKVFRDGLYNINSDRQSLKCHSTLLNMMLLVQHACWLPLQKFIAGPSVQIIFLQILWMLALWDV